MKEKLFYIWGNEIAKTLTHKPENYFIHPKNLSKYLN